MSAARPSLDWPLSREEKRKCALELYEQDVRAANHLLRSRDVQLKQAHKEIKELRRLSLCSSASAADLRCGDSEGRVSGASTNAGEDHSADGSGRSTPESAAFGGAEEASEAAGSAELPATAALDAAGAAAPGKAAPEAPREAQEPVRTAPQDTHLPLQASLRRFYAHLQDGRSEAEVEVMARRWAGEGAPELWAMIATKYALPPQRAVWWLADSTGSLAPVQWPKGKVPEAARRAVAGLAGQAAGGGKEVAGPRADALRAALQEGSLDALRAIAFHGCPGRALRPRLWRTLLEVHGGPVAEQREAYRKLRADVSKSEEALGDEAAARLRAEVAADAKAAWKDEPFLGWPGVADAVFAVAHTHALQHRQHTPGSCELAALLLYALLPKDASQERLAEAEADTFLCLSRLLEEIGGGLADGGIRVQALRIHGLLRRYDPPVAELLTSHGLGALPATRLGMALCTRAGFALEDCLQLWDPLLADPQRFDFCDHVVVALLLLNRKALLSRQGDAGGVAEALLASPRKVVVGTLLRVAHAVCAFERRCGPGDRIHFPPVPVVGRSFWPPAAGAGCGLGNGAEEESAQGQEPELHRLFPPVSRQPSLGGLQVANLWGKIRDHSVGAWKAGRSRVAEAFPPAKAPQVAPVDAAEAGAAVPGSLAATAAVEVGII